MQHVSRVTAECLCNHALTTGTLMEGRLGRWMAEVTIWLACCASWETAGHQPPISVQTRAAYTPEEDKVMKEC